MIPQRARAAFVVSLMFGAFVCLAAYPLARQEATPELKPIPEGQAIVYLFNASGRTLFTSSQSFKMDRHDVAKLSREEYTDIAVDPGTHTFDAAGQKITIEIEAGKYYFLRYAFSPGKSWARGLGGKPYSFVEVTEDQGRELMNTYKRIERPARVTP